MMSKNSSGWHSVGSNSTESTGMSFFSNRAPLKGFLVWLASP